MKAFLWAFGGGILGAFLVILAERVLSPVPLLASVDLKAVLTENVARIGQQDLDDAGRRRASTAFAQALERSLDDLAREDHALLLAGPAVVRGAPDLTDALRQRVQGRLGAHVDATVGAP